MSASKVIKISAVFCTLLFAYLFTAPHTLVTAGQLTITSSHISPSSPRPTLALGISDIVISPRVVDPALVTVSSTGLTNYVFSLRHHVDYLLSSKDNFATQCIATLRADVASLKAQVKTSSASISSLRKQLSILTSEAERKDSIIEAGKREIAQQDEQRWSNWTCKVQLEAYKADWSFWFWCVGSVLKAVGLLAIGLGMNWCKKGSYCRNFTDAFALAASTEMVSHIESLRIKKELVGCKKELQEQKDQHTSSCQTSESSYNFLWQRYTNLEAKCAKVTAETVELLQTVKLSKEANASLRELLRQATASHPIQTKRFAQPAKAPSQQPAASLAIQQVAQIKALNSQVAHLTAENSKLQQAAEFSLAPQHQAEVRLSQAQLQSEAPAEATKTVSSLPAAQPSADTQQLAAAIAQLRKSEKTLRYKLNIAEQKIIHLNALQQFTRASASPMQSVQSAPTVIDIETQLANSRREAASLKNQLTSEQKLTSTVPLLKAQISFLECSTASLQVDLASLNAARQAAEQQHMQDRREAAHILEQRTDQLQQLQITSSEFDLCFNTFVRSFRYVTSTDPAEYNNITGADFDQLITQIDRLSEQYNCIDELKTVQYEKLAQLRAMVEGCRLMASRKGLKSKRTSPSLASPSHKRTGGRRCYY